MATPQTPKEEKPERKIGVIETPPLVVEFGADNEAIIKEMIGAKYGESPPVLTIDQQELER